MAFEAIERANRKDESREERVERIVRLIEDAVAGSDLPRAAAAVGVTLMAHDFDLLRLEGPVHFDPKPRSFAISTEVMADDAPVVRSKEDIVFIAAALPALPTTTVVEVST